MKRKIFLVLLVIGLIAPTTIVFAHKAECIEVESSIVKFQFDTGDAMEGSNIEVLTSDGKSLFSGKLSEDGLFDYADYFGKAEKIVANDGGGHMVEYIIPASIPTAQEILELQEKRLKDAANKRLMRIVGIVLVIIVAVLAFMKYKKSWKTVTK